MLILLLSLTGCDFIDSLVSSSDTEQQSAPSTQAPARDGATARPSPPSDEPSADAPEVTFGEAQPVQETSSLIRSGSLNRPPEPEGVITQDMCQTIEDGGELMDDCLTGVVSCDQTITGHTVGGVKRYDSRFYERNFCTPRLSDFDGGNERIYRFDAPGDRTRAVVTLETPCADLSVAALQHAGNTCPSASDSIRRCEKDRRPKPGTGRDDRPRRELILDQIEPNRWYLVVEGADDQEGPFALHVQCTKF